MKKIVSKIEYYVDQYETIAMCAESIIDMINKSRLKKADKELLTDAIDLIHEIRYNEE